MWRSYVWLGFEGLALLLALGGVIEGYRELAVYRFDAALGWFAVWAAGCAFHEWRKEQRAREPEELNEP